MSSAFDPKMKTSVVIYRQTPLKYQSSDHINNLKEEKENFLKFGKVPKFKFAGSVDWLGPANKKKTEIRFDFLPEARYILERVRDIFGSGDVFLDLAFGKRISPGQASHTVLQYLKSHGLDGSLNVIWASDLNGSGKMFWQGPSVRYNRPEARKFTLWLKQSSENVYLREHGINSLMDHEIGTHFLRATNDGLQPWYSNRKKFDLRSPKSYIGMVNEEGLAAVNTIYQAQVKMLFLPALLYYTACMSTRMSFKELFEHLAVYMNDPEQRWKQVVRAKRCLPDCSEVGGCGYDQCYFEGAVMILRQVNEIDFKLLYSGKICCDELQRVKRIARQDCVKLPHFLKDIVTYRKTLNQIALTNGLIQKINLPLSCRNTLRKKARKKNNCCASTDDILPSKALSCPSRTCSGFQFETALQPRILSRRSRAYRRLCTSVASFSPLPS